LLKSSELAAYACYLEVAYNTLSSFRVNTLFQVFSLALSFCFSLHLTLTSPRWAITSPTS